jgi:hypothetical protein
MENATSPEPTVQLDEDSVQQLTDLGFAEVSEGIFKYNTT